ncbi:MAG: TRAP transporter small permease subunit [Desulfuromonadaceae bacterium]|nr:TRAP transporter small permease subunit [Desulfuromonadaceae bacterium]
MLTKIEQKIDRFTDWIGAISTALLILMLVNVFYDAIMRYFFRTGSIALQEMEWHLFSIVFLFGVAYALKEDGHVRVDILYDHLSSRTKALINIAGAVLLIFPLSFLVIKGSFWFVHEAYTLHEISGDPGGLTHRWLIKAVIPVSFVFLCLSTIGFILRQITIFRGTETPRPPSHDDNIL